MNHVQHDCFVTASRRRARQSLIETGVLSAASPERNPAMPPLSSGGGGESLELKIKVAQTPHQRLWRVFRYRHE